HLSPALGHRILRDSLTLVRALGYDMNSMEWAVRDGVPYAIDFMNPAPDMDIYSLTEHYFEWVVQHMADMAIRLARNPRQQAAQLGWQQLFQGSRDLGTSPVIAAPTRPSSEPGTTFGGGRSAASGSSEADGGLGSGTGGRSGHASTAHSGLLGSTGGRAADDGLSSSAADGGEIGNGRPAAGPGDAPDAVVDEQASEGHA
ncbi:MAG TPA: hypothetical protein VF142_02855, partial [Longimicrobium sp.]